MRLSPSAIVGTSYGCEASEGIREAGQSMCGSEGGNRDVV